MSRPKLAARGRRAESGPSAPCDPSPATGWPRAPGSGSNLLDFGPERTAPWNDAGDRVVVERPAPAVRGIRSVAARLAWLMAPRRVRLDDRGSFVWRRLDGRPLRAVCDEVRERFGEKAEPVEQRVGLLLHRLRAAGLVTWEDE